MTRLRLIILFFIFLIFPLGGLAISLQPGDDAFLQRADPDRARFALKHFQTTYSHNAGEDEAWRLAMACQYVGLNLIESPAEKQKLFLQGIQAGRRGVELNSECVPCHFWTAVNLALYGQSVGVWRMLGSLRDVLAHLRVVVRLDPSYAFGGAHRILGLIHQHIPGFLGGGKETARDYLEKAIAQAPGSPLNYFFLARLYAEEFSNKSEALRVARVALSFPLPSRSEVESHGAWSDLAALHQQLLR